MIRALMGAMEGSYCPTSFTAVAAASRPERRGFNQGLAAERFRAARPGARADHRDAAARTSCRRGAGCSGSSRSPGFVVGALLFVVLREPRETQGGALIGATRTSGSWLEVLKSRNIVFGMLALFCAMSCVFVLSAMVPTYLVELSEAHARSRWASSRRRSASAVSSGSSAGPWRLQGLGGELLAQLQGPGGILDYLQGFQPRDIRKEPAAAGVHEQGVALHLQELQGRHPIVRLRLGAPCPAKKSSRTPSPRSRMTST